MLKNYQETIEYLYSKLPVFQNQGTTAYRPGLERTRLLLQYLDNPHQNKNFIHIAGTNGKGTTAHALASVLQSAHCKVGLYTSPHLKNFTERIKIKGQEVDKNWIVYTLNKMEEAISKIKPSFFEVTVCLALKYFEENAVDWAVIETGMGGRLDSTNVINPAVALITNISFDHMSYLGNSIEKIAKEKAGIIKNNTPVVLGCDMKKEALEVIIEQAQKKNASLFETKFLPNEKYNLENCPPYFEKNLPAILKTIEVLRNLKVNITHERVKDGIENFIQRTQLKGRFQKLSNSPVIIADIAHNEEGLKVLFEYVNKTLKFQKLHLIFGMVKDKNIENIMKILPQNALYYWTQSSIVRRLEVETLAKMALQIGLSGSSFLNVNEALSQAKKKATNQDVILVTGSTFVVADIENL